MIRRAIKRDSWQGPDLVDSWMVTFTDLLTLLVTLFVMLLSMSALKSGRVEPDHNTTWQPSVETPMWPADPTQEDADLAPQQGIGVVGARIVQHRMGLSASGLVSGYELYHDARGLVLRFEGAPMVTGGGISRAGKARLARLADYLVRSGQSIVVTSVARNNADWAQAAVDAERVARRLIEVGVNPAQVVPVARVQPYPDDFSVRRISGVEFVFND